VHAPASLRVNEKPSKAKAFEGEMDMIYLDKLEFVYRTISNVPAPIRMQPTIDFAVKSS
jgi:hypothetical protein